MPVLPAAKADLSNFSAVSGNSTAKAAFHILKGCPRSAPEQSATEHYMSSVALKMYETPLDTAKLLLEVDADASGLAYGREIARRFYQQYGIGIIRHYLRNLELANEEQDNPPTSLAKALARSLYGTSCFSTAGEIKELISRSVSLVSIRRTIQANHAIFWMLDDIYASLSLKAIPLTQELDDSFGLDRTEVLALIRRANEHPA